MRPVALYTFGPLNATYASCVPPFPTILALQDIWVYVSTANYSNKASYIKVSVNYFLGIGPILCVPNVNPNYNHIGFGRDLDNIRLGYKNDVIEYVIVL